MSKATMTVEGVLARDVTINRTGTGRGVATLVVPHMPRRKNRDTGEWEDAAPVTTWVEASLWNEDADQVADWRKGDVVIMTGQPQLETYEKRDGTVSATVKLVFATVGLVKRSQAPQEARGQANSGGWAQEPTQATSGAQAGAQWAAAEPGGGGWDANENPPW